jgi:hypothetical protein
MGRKAYFLKPHEEDVLRQLRGLSEEQYDEVLAKICAFKAPVAAGLLHVFTRLDEEED